ncbi:MAG: LacI family DNA-binding transcriptional regulator [Mycobacteriales bacterium]
MRVRPGGGPQVRPPPTLATVAAAAGVSPATVSRVVNGVETVAQEHRIAVQEAITQLGYVPNRAARSLVTRRTGSVALLVREPVGFAVSDPYVGSVIVAASQCLAEHGCQLVVMMAREDDDTSAGEYARAGHIDGALLVSLHREDPLPQQLLSAGVPIVACGRPPMDLPGLAYVDVDNIGGGRLAVARLLETGRTRIATVAGPADMTGAQDRLRGFRAAVADAGLNPDLVATASFTQASGERAVEQLLAAHADIDGVFVASDVMAFGALRALRRMGRSVPSDVAVIGFDDIEAAQYADPPLTTVRQPAGEQARAMVEALMAQIRGEEPRGQVTLTTSLVVRESG